MTLYQGVILLIAEDLEKIARRPQDYCHWAFEIVGQPEYTTEGYAHVTLKVLK